MAESTIQNAVERTLPIKRVRARQGKYVRAEPVAALYEQSLPRTLIRGPRPPRRPLPRPRRPDVYLDRRPRPIPLPRPRRRPRPRRHPAHPKPQPPHLLVNPKPCPSPQGLSIIEECHSEPERSAGEESHDPHRWLVRRCFGLRPQHDRLFEFG